MLIVFDIRRYESTILQLAELAVERGAEIVLITDAEMEQAAKSLWFEFGIAADLSGAAALAALQSGRAPLSGGEKVCALVCGAGTDGCLPG